MEYVPCGCDVRMYVPCVTCHVMNGQSGHVTCVLSMCDVNACDVMWDMSHTYAGHVTCVNYIPCVTCAMHVGHVMRDVMWDM